MIRWMKSNMFMSLVTGPRSLKQTVEGVTLARLQNINLPTLTILQISSHIHLVSIGGGLITKLIRNFLLCPFVLLPRSNPLVIGMICRPGI